jgi:hypothetical protein
MVISEGKLRPGELLERFDVVSGPDAAAQAVWSVNAVMLDAWVAGARNAAKISVSEGKIRRGMSPILCKAT